MMIEWEEDEAANLFRIDRIYGNVIRTPLAREYTDTIRIDDSTVEDVTYTFDLVAGQYVETARVQRNEPIPPAIPTSEDRIVTLEEENVQLKDRLATSESATAENSMTMQLLLEELILKEVI